MTLQATRARAAHVYCGRTIANRQGYSQSATTPPARQLPGPDFWEAGHSTCHRYFDPGLCALDACSIDRSPIWMMSNLYPWASSCMDHRRRQFECRNVPESISVGQRSHATILLGSDRLGLSKAGHERLNNLVRGPMA